MPFSHKDDFLKMERDFKDLCPLQRGFSSAWILWEYDYTNAAGKRTPDHYINHLMLAVISFLKPLVITNDG